MEKKDDSRFTKIRNDPRFKPLPKHKRKVEIDKRFEGMFKDPKFKLKYQVDKRGRPISLSTNDHLKRYYDLKSSDESSESNAENEVEVKQEIEEVQTERNKDKKQSKDRKESKESKKSKIVVKGVEEKKVGKPKEAVSKDDKPKQKKHSVIEKVPGKSSKQQSKKELDKKIETGSENNSESEDENLIRAKPKKTINKRVKSLKVEQPESEESDRETSDEESNADEVESDVKDEELDEEENGDVKDKLKDLTLDYARGEGVLVTDSSDDSESSESDEEEDKVSHPWGELDADAERTEDVTSRLAICNMDWDRIHAVDLMILLNSFVQQNGCIKAVTIYPSEFGIERLKEEDLRGPKEIVESKVLLSDEEDGSDDEYQTEKLRQYQLNRLKYYYAVAVFDSPETAAKVYDECDGMEYESSSTKLDLRYVPDDMEFDHDPKEECTALPDLTRYEPKFFTTTALQQAQVQLTWEENDPQRKANMEKFFDTAKLKGKEIDDDAIRQYLATSSSEDEDSGLEDRDEDDEENKDSVAKYRALLADVDKDKKDDKDGNMEMEITWGVGLKEKAEQLVEKKLSGKDKLTPWEQYLEKKKEKKKQKKEKTKKKEETESEADEDDEEDDIPSDVDMDDPYFREEFENNPDFKPVKKAPKSKKPISEDLGSDSDQSDRKKAELELLLGDNDDGRKHFSLKKIIEGETKSKKKKKGSKGEPEQNDGRDDFTIKVEDPRFSALFSSHHYNVDPSDPNFKKTNAMTAILAEKQKRRQRGDESVDEPIAKQAKTEGKKMDPMLSNLVRNVKSKVNTAKLKSRKKD